MGILYSIFRFLFSILSGIAVSMLSKMFIDYWQRRTVQSLDNQGALPDLRRKLERLQAEIDAVNRSTASIGSEFNYNAISQIDNHDQVNELNLGNDVVTPCYGDNKETNTLKKKLDSIDKKLEGDDEEVIELALDELKDLCVTNPENVELLYRIGKVHVRLSKVQPEDVIRGRVKK